MVTEDWLYDEVDHSLGLVLQHEARRRRPVIDPIRRAQLRANITDALAARASDGLRVLHCPPLRASGEG